MYSVEGIYFCLCCNLIVSIHNLIVTIVNRYKGLGMQLSGRVLAEHAQGYGL
jgi:hypothetical protein